MTAVTELATAVAASQPDSIIDVLLRIILTIIFGLIAQLMVKLASRFIRHRIIKKGKGPQAERAARARSLVMVFTAIATSLIWIIVVGIILSYLGVNAATLLASAGIIGLAITFGSQELAKDIISGAFMLSENQFNIGDKIQINDKKGVVTSIGLRTVTFHDEENKATYIARNSLVSLLSRYDPELDKEAPAK